MIIKELLNSSNIDDVVLGIIIGMREEILLDMFTEVPSTWKDIYDIRFSTNNQWEKCSKLIVAGNMFFLGVHYSDICRVCDSPNHFMEISRHYETIYNDGSIPEITEGI